MRHVGRAGLRLFVSCAMVVGLVPSPALAEALGDSWAAEAVIAEGTDSADATAAQDAGALEAAVVEGGDLAPAAGAQDAASADPTGADTTTAPDETAPEVATSGTDAAEGGDLAPAAGAQDAASADPTDADSTTAPDETVPEEATSGTDVAAGDQLSAQETGADAVFEEAAHAELQATIDEAYDVVGPEELFLGEYRSVSVKEGQVYVGIFTAPQAGAYVWSSTGDADTSGTLFADAELTSEIAFDDDSGTCDNFSLVHHLDESQTVYLVACGYDCAAADFTVQVSDVGKDLSFGRIGLNQREYDYTGRPIELAHAVYDADGNALTEGVDYVLAYCDEDGEDLDSAPTEPGRYSVCARAIGDVYVGQTNVATLSVVTDADLAFATLDLDEDRFSWTGGPVELLTHVTLTSRTGSILIEGSDYELVYLDSDYGELAGAPTEPGSYLVHARAVGGTYTGSTGMQWFDIVSENDLSRATLELSEDTFDWTGDPIDLSTRLSVSSGTGTTLVEGVDYELAYYDRDYEELPSAPTEPGEYHVYARAIGSAFSGETKPVWFSVVSDLDLALATFALDDDSFDWTGAPVDLARQVTVTSRAGTTLTEGVDYELVYCDEDGVDLSARPTESGTYGVYARALGDTYAGRTDMWLFDLVSDANLCYAELQLSERTVVWTGKAVELSSFVTLTSRSGSVLAEGSDYVLAYCDEDGNDLPDAPTEPGAYYVYARPASGAFVGQTDMEWFEIALGVDLSSAALELDENAFAWTGEAVDLSPYVTVTSLLGAPLTGDVDYELVFCDEDGNDLGFTPVDPGRYHVCARAVGNTYTGQTDAAYFHIARQAAPKALTLGLDQAVSVAEAEVFVGVFTAPEAGAYVFCGEGAADVFGMLYADSELTDELDFVAEWDDSDDFSMTCQLEEGETVYLAARGFDFTAADFVVRVAKTSGDLSFADLLLDRREYAHTGSPVEPACAVSSRTGAELVEGTDYELVFRDADGVLLDSAPTEMGEYYVCARGIGDVYTGQTGAAWFEIVSDADLSHATLELDEDTFAWTGAAVELSPYVTVTSLSGAALNEGVDYELAYYDRDYNDLDRAPTDPGSYYVRVRGVGGFYTGETDARWFRIPSDADLSCATLELDGDVFVGRGAEVDLSTHVTVTSYAGTRLVEGIDYELVYGDEEGGDLASAPTDEGAYYVYARAIGSVYSGRTEVDWFCIPAGSDLAFATLDLDERSFDWTGGAVDLAKHVTVTSCTGIVLKEGVDYELVYSVGDGDGASGSGDLASAPVDQGEYLVRARGIGSAYRGQTGSEWFEIHFEGNLSSAVLELEADAFSWSGAAIDLSKCVTLTSRNGIVLTQGVDYELVYGDADGVDLGKAPADPGAYCVWAVACEGGIYEGRSACRDFRIARVDISDAKLVVGGAAFSYAGTKIEPAVTVVLGGRTLVAGADYNVAYADNVNVGVATVRVTGTGGYEGSVGASFTIVERASSIALASQSAVYTGAPIAYGGKVTRTGSVGAVSYAYYSDAACTKPVAAANVKDAGTYYVRATVAADANNAAATSAAAKLVITAKKVTPAVKLSRTSYVYNGKANKPGVTVYAGKVKLKAGADYVVSYASGRKNAGTYKVTVTLKGNYSGVGVASFKVAKAANTLVAKARGATVRYAKLKKANVAVVAKTAFSVSKAQGAVSYKTVSGNARILVSSAGKVTVKKGLKKGTYKVKVKVRAKGTTNFKPATRTVTLKVVVK